MFFQALFLWVCVFDSVSFRELLLEVINMRKPQVFEWVQRRCFWYEFLVWHFLKALRVINFKERIAHWPLLFHYCKIIQILEKVSVKNCLFISKCSNNKLRSVFTIWFTFSSIAHNYQRSFASKGNIKIPSVQTIWYRKMILCIVL